MDVVVWLRSLGLGKYEAAFRENEIDERVLPSRRLGDTVGQARSALAERSDRAVRLQTDNAFK